MIIGERITVVVQNGMVAALIGEVEGVTKREGEVGKMTMIGLTRRRGDDLL